MYVGVYEPRLLKGMLGETLGKADGGQEADPERKENLWPGCVKTEDPEDLAFGKMVGKVGRALVK